MRIEIISRHPQFIGRAMRIYALNAAPHIGVWGDEPYAIRLINDGGQRIGVRLSIDGTDVLTGKPASTSAEGSMLMLNAYQQSEIKAWPESAHGGAALVFRQAEASVAKHTHGDTRSMGVIAAAVFIEGWEPPVYRGPMLGVSSMDSHVMRGGGSLETMAKRGGAGTGAGEYQSQEMHTVQGFRRPTLREQIAIHYMWWDELQAALRASGQTEAAMSGRAENGFPGDASFSGINIGSTPRQSPGSCSPHMSFERFAR